MAVLLFPAFLLFCFPAFALDPSLTLDQLNDPSYTVRERASRALLQDETVTVDELRLLYGRAQTPEQRHRVMDGLRHHALRLMRQQGFDETDAPPAVGFSHEVLPAGSAPGVDDPAVYISATLPGFPGHAHLQAGDLVTAVDGEPLPDDATPDSFKQMLQRYKAGATITLNVVRDGDKLRVQLRLASMEALEKLYAEDSPPSLRPPYLQQWLTLRDHVLSETLPPPALHVPLAPVPPAAAD